jgi:hypothetical protein
MTRALKLVSIWGLFSTFVFFNYFLSIFATDPKFQSRGFISFAGYLQTAWEVMQLVFYATIYLMTISSPTKYRPAAMVWSRFWSFYRLLIITSMVMMTYHVRGGHCLYSVSTLIFFVIMKIWIAFKCYRLEARWWHGDDEFGDANIECLVKFYTSIFNLIGYKASSSTSTLTASRHHPVPTSLIDPLITPTMKHGGGGGGGGGGGKIRNERSNEREDMEGSARLRSKTLAMASPLAGLQLSGKCTVSVLFVIVS